MHLLAEVADLHVYLEDCPTEAKLIYDWWAKVSAVIANHGEV